MNIRNNLEKFFIQIRNKKKQPYTISSTITTLAKTQTMYTQIIECTTYAINILLDAEKMEKVILTFTTDANDEFDDTILWNDLITCIESESYTNYCVSLMRKNGSSQLKVTSTICERSAQITLESISS